MTQLQIPFGTIGSMSKRPSLGFGKIGKRKVSPSFLYPVFFGLLYLAYLHGIIFIFSVWWKGRGKKAKKGRSQRWSSVNIVSSSISAELGSTGESLPAHLEPTPDQQPRYRSLKRRASREPSQCSSNIERALSLCSESRNVCKTVFAELPPSSPYIPCLKRNRKFEETWLVRRRT